MLKNIAVVVALAAAACGGGSKPATTTTTTTEPVKAVPTSALELGELKLTDTNKNKSVLVHADGTIELEGKQPVKITPEGKLVRTDTGEVGFTIEADGSVKGPKGEMIATLTADATLTVGDTSISIDDQGNLVGGNAGAPPLKVEGATSPGLKRTALFVLLAITAASQPVPAPQ